MTALHPANRAFTLGLLAIGAPLRQRVHSLRSAHVIIVLGTTVRPNGSPSKGMRQRVLFAAWALRMGLSSSGKLLLTGGRRSFSKAEAEVMEDCALQAGVARGDLVLEDQSQTTEENARNCLRIMTQRGWESALIVTSPYHVRRAGLIFAHNGVRCTVVEAFSPAEYKPLLHAKVLLHEYGAWAKIIVLAIQRHTTGHLWHWSRRVDQKYGDAESRQ